ISILDQDDSKPRGIIVKINILKDYLSVKLFFLNLNNKFLKPETLQSLIQRTKKRLNVFSSSSEFQIQITQEKDEIIIMLDIALANNITWPGAQSEKKINPAFY